MSFSAKYQTYGSWRKAQSANSNYVKKIDRLHALYPQAKLSQLRGHPKNNQKPLTKITKKTGKLPPIESLTGPQQDRYERSLEALKLMRRNGMSLTQAARQVNLSPETVKNMMGKAIESNGSRYNAKPSDQLERIMYFYDDRGLTIIKIKSSKSASLIGQYHASIKKYTYTGDFSDVMKFKGKSIVDAYGIRHEFITDKLQINNFARSGEIRFESIYQFIVPGGD